MQPPNPPYPVPALPNYFISSLAQTLNEGGNDTSIQLGTIFTLDGQQVQTSDFATFGRGILTIDPLNLNAVEFASFTGVTLGTPPAGTVTGVLRGLSDKGNAQSSANQTFHVVGTPVLIAFGTHNIIDLVAMINNTYTTLLMIIDAAVINGAVPATTTVPGISMIAEPADLTTGNDQRTYGSLEYPLFVQPSQVLGVTPGSYLAAATISALQPVYMKSYTPSGGLSFDNNLTFNGSVTGPGSSTTNQTYVQSYTVGTISNGMMLVSVSTFTNFASTTNPTDIISASFNGVAMTLVDSLVQGYNFLSQSFEMRVSTFLLPSPAIGTHNLEVTVTVSNGSPTPYTASIPTSIATYANVHQSTTPDAHGYHFSNNYPTPAAISNSITTVASNALVWSMNAFHANSTSAFTAGAPNNGSTFTGVTIGDSGVIGSPGINTATASSSGGYAGVVASISLAPFASATFGIAPADSADTAHSATFIGFAPTGGSQNSNVNVISTGIISGLSGITPAVYYLNDTAGTIGTSPGTVTKAIGIGVSATELLILNT